mgnify:FL=1
MFVYECLCFIERGLNGIICVGVVVCFIWVFGLLECVWGYIFRFFRSYIGMTNDGRDDVDGSARRGRAMSTTTSGATRTTRGVEAARASRSAFATGARVTRRGTTTVGRPRGDGGRRRSRRAGVARALFTGLVQGKARVRSFENLNDEFARLTLGFPAKTLDGILIGASVAVNGTCLTVVELGDDGESASFDLIVETLRATNLGKLEVGSEVNYERSARVGDEIGGHTVSGHVHCTADVVEVVDSEHNRKVVFEVSDTTLIKYVLPKGFISIDGCSLTVGEVDKNTGRFNVWLIPETLRVTVLGDKTVGDTVNVEIESQTQVIVDTIERYMVERGL